MNNHLTTYAVILIAVLIPAKGIAEPVIGTAEILSGETLRVDGKVFRLVGIDAPETGQICKNKVGKSFDCGRIATTGMMDLTVGSNVRCTAIGDTDHSPPVLATCSAGGYDLSEGMVYTGWALADPATGTHYKRYEKQAMTKKHGLWAGTFDAPWIWRKNKR